MSPSKLNSTGMTHLCGVCKKSATSGTICCSGKCQNWHHFKCVGLTYSNVKTWSPAQLNSWKCLNCTSITHEKVIESDEEVELKTNNITESNNLLPLANEVDYSILRENEKLKQEVHEAKINSSLLELQLEDDLKQKEEEFESFKKAQELKVIELEEKVKTLEIRLKKEKQLNEQLILHVEEDNLPPKLNSSLTTAVGRCNKCTILREELNNMISSIKSLESIISIYQNENLKLTNNMSDLEISKSNCLTCFPTLNAQANGQVTSDWKKVHYKNNKHVQTNIISSKPSISLSNSFEIFSDIPSDNEEVSPTDQEELNNLVVVPSKNQRKRKQKTVQAINHNSIMNHKIVKEETKKPKIRLLLCADSHGRDLAFHLNNSSNSHEAVGFVRPGACVKDILIKQNIKGEKLKAGDILLIMAGSNDIARNEAKGAIDKLSEVMKNYSNHKIILVNIPVRHDLAEWSCVNLEIKKTNDILKEISNGLKHVTLVDVSLANRKLHTRHGQHFNKLGKKWLADKICKAAEEREVLSTDLVNEVEILEGGKELTNYENLPKTSSDETVQQENTEKCPIATQKNLSPSSENCPPQAVGTVT